MKVTMTTDALRQLIASVIGATSTGDGIMACVLLTADDVGILRARASDYEIEATSWTEALDTEPGGICVPGRAMLAICGVLPKDQTVTLERESIATIRITCDGSTWEITGYPETEFPDGTKLTKDREATIDREAVCAALQASLPFVGHDASRPSICGVSVRGKLDGLTMFATDGLRMGINTLAVTGLGKGEWIVPTKGAAMMRDLLSASVAKTANLTVYKRSVGIEIGNTTVLARCVDAVGPDYERVLPPAQASRVVVLDCAKVKSTLARVMAVKSRDVPMRMTFGGDLVDFEINAEAGGKSRAKTGAAMAGGLFASNSQTIGINPVFLRQALESSGADTVNVQVGGEMDPIRISADARPDWLHVLMPMRL